jgi:hypothetical protein
MVTATVSPETRISSGSSTATLSSRELPVRGSWTRRVAWRLAMAPPRVVVI